MFGPGTADVTGPKRAFKLLETNNRKPIGQFKNVKDGSTENGFNCDFRFELAEKSTLITIESNE